jgi:hypothetical protein
LIYPKKNSYFADQIRFLEKIIRNDAHSWKAAMQVQAYKQ